MTDREDIGTYKKDRRFPDVLPLKIQSPKSAEVLHNLTVIAYTEMTARKEGYANLEDDEGFTDRI